MYVPQVGNRISIIIWLSKVLENNAIESNPVSVHILNSSQFILTKQQRQPGQIMREKKEGFSKILTSTRPTLLDIANQSPIKPAHVLCPEHAHIPTTVILWD